MDTTYYAPVNGKALLGQVRDRANYCPDSPYAINGNWGQVTSLRKRDPKLLVAQKGTGLGHWLIGCNLTRDQFPKTRMPVNCLRWKCNHHGDWSVPFVHQCIFPAD